MNQSVATPPRGDWLTPRAESPPPESILTLERILQNPPQAPRKTTQYFGSSSSSRGEGDNDPSSSNNDYSSLALAWPVNTGSGLESMNDDDNGIGSYPSSFGEEDDPARPSSTSSFSRLPMRRKLFHRSPLHPLTQQTTTTPSSPIRAFFRHFRYPQAASLNADRENEEREENGQQPSSNRSQLRDGNI